MTQAVNVIRKLVVWTGKIDCKILNDISRSRRIQMRQVVSLLTLAKKNKAAWILTAYIVAKALKLLKIKT